MIREVDIGTLTPLDPGFLVLKYPGLSWVLTYIGNLLKVQDYEKVNFHTREIKHWYLKG